MIFPEGRYYLETNDGYLHIITYGNRIGHSEEKQIDEGRLVTWTTAEDCEAWAKNNNYEVIKIHQWLRHD